MVRNVLLTLACLLAWATSSQAQLTVAHRGHWTAPGSAQNSVRSLVKADSIGCFGSEFDVWITADDVLVVHHDAAASGLVIENSRADDVCALALANGEHVPTLDALLDTAAALTVRLVCEIKPHVDKTREAEAVRRTVAMIGAKGLASRTDYITFSREALESLISIVPAGTEVYYLSGDMSPEELKAIGAAGPDYNIKVYRDRHPDWIARAHGLGLKVNIWTVNSDEDLRWSIGAGADYITTNRPGRLLEMLGE